jgi:hypothetical protein
MTRLNESELADRIKQLERRQHWLTVFGLVLLVPFLTAAVETVSPQDEPLEVRGLWVIDDSGIRRIGLTVEETGPGIGIYDDQGQFRIGLTVQNDQSVIGMYDQTGQLTLTLAQNTDGASLDFLNPRLNLKTVALGSTKEGVPGLTLYDLQGQARAYLNVEKAGAALGFYGPSGVQRILLIDQGQQQALKLKDARGTTRAAVGFADGDPGFLLYDANGTWRAGLSHGENGGILILRDANGDSRATLAQNDEFGGWFTLSDERGREVSREP